MKSIILAAGYATRMGELTKDKPKTFLEIGEKKIIDHIIDNIPAEVNQINIVTNSIFLRQFKNWVHSSSKKDIINIIDDGSTCNENRVGAVKDMLLGINYKGRKDSLVIASDNLFDFSLQGIIERFYRNKIDLVVATDIKDTKKASLFGVIKKNKKGIITEFIEKPSNPESTTISTGIYVIKKESIHFLQEYSKKGKNIDKLGDFISWFSKQKKVECFVPSGKWYDIGNIECYEKAKKEFFEDY
ncbi:MAG: nucleotidyltransferase family protein [archaeon]